MNETNRRNGLACGSLSTHYNMRSFWWYDNFPFPLPLSHYTSLTTSLTLLAQAGGLESFILVTVGWVCMVPSVLLEVITSSSDSFSHRCHRNPGFFEVISLTNAFLLVNLFKAEGMIEGAQSDRDRPEGTKGNYWNRNILWKFSILSISSDSLSVAAWLTLGG